MPIATTINTTQAGVPDRGSFKLNNFTGYYLGESDISFGVDGKVEFQSDTFYIQREGGPVDSKDFQIFYSDAGYTHQAYMEMRDTSTVSLFSLNTAQPNGGSFSLEVRSQTSGAGWARLRCADTNTIIGAESTSIKLQPPSGGTLDFVDIDSGVNEYAIQWTVPSLAASYGLTLPDAQGAGALYNDGAGVLSWKKTWTTSIKTTTYTASSEEEIFTDTTGGAWTLTLPASPAIGDRVKIIDGKDNWATDNLSIAGNGENINGDVGPLVANVDGNWFELVYMDATEGWRVLNS